MACLLPGKAAEVGIVNGKISTGLKKNLRRLKTEISINHINLRNFGTSSGHSTIILYFFWRTTMGRPFLCLCRPFMIFEEFELRVLPLRYHFSHPSFYSGTISPFFKLQTIKLYLTAQGCALFAGMLFLCALILAFWSGTFKLSLF